MAAYADTPDTRSSPMASSYLPSASEAERVRLVEDRFREAEDARRALDETWLECVAFRAGKQWHRYNWHTGQLELPKAPSWRIRATHNLVRPKVAQAAAALVGDLPMLDVQPMSTQPQDIQSARTGKQLLEYLDKRLKWLKLYLSVGQWMAMTGTAFIKSYWDPTQRDAQAVPVTDPTGQPMLGPDGQPMFQALPGPIGQVATDIVTPFEMYPQPGVQDWPAVEWCIHTRIRSLDYIRTRYPQKGQLVKGEEPTGDSGFLERRVSDILDAGSGGTRFRRNEATAAVMEYWEKPCSKYPEGRQITVCQGIELRSRDLPYAHLIEQQKLPFTPFTYECYDLRVWGQGLVEDLLPLQKEYNRILSDLMMMLKLTGMPKILLPLECNVVSSLRTDEPGEVLKYSNPLGNTKPEYWTPPPIVSTWLEMLDRIRNDIDDIAMRHQVSQGSTLPGVTAGISIQLLQGADDTAFGPLRALYHDSISDHGQQSLALAKEWYSEPRIGYTIGETDQRQILAFRASDLPNYADVTAVASSSTPMSRAAKQQQLFDLYDRGAFGPPGSPVANMTLLKRLEFGDVEKMVDEQVAQQRAQAEQQMQMQQAKGEQAMHLQAQRGEQAAGMADQQQAAQLERDAARGDQQAELEALRATMRPMPRVN